MNSFTGTQHYADIVTNDIDTNTLDLKIDADETAPSPGQSRLVYKTIAGNKCLISIDDTGTKRLIHGLGETIYNVLYEGTNTWDFANTGKLIEPNEFSIMPANADGGTYVSSGVFSNAITDYATHTDSLITILRSGIYKIEAMLHYQVVDGSPIFSTHLVKNGITQIGPNIIHNGGNNHSKCPNFVYVGSFSVNDTINFRVNNIFTVGTGDILQIRYMNITVKPISSIIIA